MTAPITNTPLLSRQANRTANRHCSDGEGCACNPEPRRLPEWMRRMQAGQLKGKDLTGAVSL